MMRRPSIAAMVGSVALACGGCTSPPVARYVYQDGQFGVIGIPRNTPLGKTNYLDEARLLMSRHFPEGYEIVRAEEVVEGERILDTAIKRELQSEPGLIALNQALKVGKFARSSSLDQKDTLHITESRIIYKRKSATGPSDPDGFALTAQLKPEFYLDPNDLARIEARDMILASSKKADAAKDGKMIAKADEKPKPAAVDGPIKDKAEVAETTMFKDDKLQQAGATKPE